MNIIVRSLSICLLVLVFVYVWSAMIQEHSEQPPAEQSYSDQTIQSTVAIAHPMSSPELFPGDILQRIAALSSNSELAHLSQAREAFHEELQTSLAERALADLNSRIERFVDSLPEQWVRDYKELLPGLEADAIITRFLCGHDALLEFNDDKADKLVIDEFNALKSRFDRHRAQFPNHLVCDAVSGEDENHFVSRFRELYTKFEEILAANSELEWGKLLMEQIGAQVGDPRLAPITASVRWVPTFQWREDLVLHFRVLAAAREPVGRIHYMIQKLKQLKQLERDDQELIWLFGTEDAKQQSFFYDLWELIQDNESNIDSIFSHHE